MQVINSMAWELHVSQERMQYGRYRGKGTQQHSGLLIAMHTPAIITQQIDKDCMS